jgi:hypothetical protein
VVVSGTVLSGDDDVVLGSAVAPASAGMMPVTATAKTENNATALREK